MNNKLIKKTKLNVEISEFENKGDIVIDITSKPDSDENYKILLSGKAAINFIELFNKYLKESK